MLFVGSSSFRGKLVAWVQQLLHPHAHIHLGIRERPGGTPPPSRFAGACTDYSD